MACIDRRDLTPDEWRSLLEVYLVAAWLSRGMRERLIRLDLIAGGSTPTLTGLGLRVVCDGIRDAMVAIRKR